MLVGSFNRFVKHVNLNYQRVVIIPHCSDLVFFYEYKCTKDRAWGFRFLELFLAKLTKAMWRWWIRLSYACSHWTVILGLMRNSYVSGLYSTKRFVSGFYLSRLVVLGSKHWSTVQMSLTEQKRLSPTWINEILRNLGFPGAGPRWLVLHWRRRHRTGRVVVTVVVRSGYWFSFIG